MQHRSSWWLSLASAGLLLALSACGSVESSNVGQAGAPSSAVQASIPAGSTPVQVGASEFAFAVAPAEVKSGSITFAVDNTGHAPHDFHISGNGVEQGTPKIDGGQSAQLTVELAPGTYSYKCTVPGHERLGMTGSLTVTP